MGATVCTRGNVLSRSPVGAVCESRGGSPSSNLEPLVYYKQMLCKFKKELISHPKFPNFRRKPSDHFFKDNRAKFTATFKAMSDLKKPFLFLKGPIEEPIYDDDTTYPVVPENFFYYLTGCYEPNTYAVYDVMGGKIMLFVKVVDSVKAFWEKHKTIDEMREEYHIDDIFSKDELQKVFAEQVPKDSTVLTYDGKNPYSGYSTLSVLPEFKVAARPD